MEKLSQKSLTARVYRFIQEEGMTLPGEKVLVAVSGGPDSVCLFDILDELKDKLKIKLAIIHYNHKQRGVESDQDEQFVRELAKERGVDCFVGQNINSNKKLSEAEARELRYAFFERILGDWSGDRLVIAHTLNDQAETLLLRLIRGASIFGLASIPLRRKKISRPLLKFARKEVMLHLKAKKLKYRLDKSNQNLDFSRNLIRQNVIPELEKLNPKALNNLALVVDLASRQSALLLEFISDKYQNLLINENKEIINLDANKLALETPLLAAEIIKMSITKLNLITDVDRKHLQAVVGLIGKKVGNKQIIINKHLQASLKQGIMSVRISKRKDT